MNNELKQYNLCFETLGNELRIKIIRELGSGPKTVQELCDSLKVEQSRLSHSLEMLKLCSLVSVKPVKKLRYYSLQSNLLTGFSEGKKDIFSLLDVHIKDFCHSDCKKCGN